MHLVTKSLESRIIKHGVLFVWNETVIVLTGILIYENIGFEKF